MSRSQEFLPIVDIDDITPGWMTALLRSRGVISHGVVSALRRERIGTGHVADSYRLTLDYDGEQGPATLIGKMPAVDARSARMGSGGLYLGEVNFYRELADQLPVRVPTPLHADIDETTGRFVLLLEDLSPADHVDQLTGCSIDQAALAVEQAAAMHSATWGRQDLAATPWLHNTITGTTRVVDHLPKLAERLRREFADVIAQEDLDTACQILEMRDQWKRVLSRTQCLWHQDFRTDNLLFDAKGGGVAVAVLDWQTVCYGPGVADLSLFLGGSIPIEERREHEVDLVHLYHRGLVAGGVSGYDFDACWSDYRLLAVHGLFNLISGAVRVARTARGDEMWRVWNERHAAHVHDLNSYRLLATM